MRNGDRSRFSFSLRKDIDPLCVCVPVRKKSVRFSVPEENFGKKSSGSDLKICEARTFHDRIPLIPGTKLIIFQTRGETDNLRYKTQVPLMT